MNIRKRNQVNLNYFGIAGFEIMKRIKLLFVIFLLFSFQQAFSSVRNLTNTVNTCADAANKPEFEENDSFQSIYGEVSSGQALFPFYDTITKYISTKFKFKAFHNFLIPSLKQSNFQVSVNLIFEETFSLTTLIPIYLKTETFRL